MTVHLWGHTAFRLHCKPPKQGGSFECTRGKQTKKRVFCFFAFFRLLELFLSSASADRCAEAENAFGLFPAVIM